MTFIRRTIGITGLRLLREFQRRYSLATTVAPVLKNNPQVTLARVIGNDLWPRHSHGQAISNLDFILKHEPSFSGCRKLFVLNRIVDPAVEAEASAMVSSHGHDCINIPFVSSEYAAITLDTSFFGGDDYFHSKEFCTLGNNLQSRERLWAAAPKIRYAMNINAARNAALEWGAARGDWTLLLDGSCFVSASAWESLQFDITSPPAASYLVISMQRLVDNIEALTTTPQANRHEEPQVGFHASAKARFDELYPYGMRDKTSLLDCIGVPGAWNTWGRMPWLPDQPLTPTDAHRWKYSRAAVFRLSSGIHGGGLEQRGAHSLRYKSRNQAVLQTLAILDDRVGHPDRSRTRAILGTSDELGAVPQRETHHSVNLSGVI